MNKDSILTLTQGTARSKTYLQKIAELRSQGLGDHISLPQLVVCGDQSAGKSSVLEGITEIPFPRAEGLCTTFATEITLLHNDNPEMEIKASIIPHNSRSEEEKQELSKFKRTLKSYEDLPDIIKEVGEKMGLRNFGSNTDGPTFGADIFSIQVSRNTGCHLTVVDLPGLIAVSENDQSSGDVEVVEKLVMDYIENPRTIIVAVLPAICDTATQKIIRLALKVDQDGKRTIGVVTRPDQINKGTESKLAKMSRNQGPIKPGLGCFLVKSPSPEELSNGNLSFAERIKLEHDFFAESRWQTPEAQLNQDRVGITNLIKFLANYLEGHIQKELPNVCLEIHRLLSDTERSIRDMGPKRQSTDDMRAYLTGISFRFHDVCSNGIKGHYEMAGTSPFKDHRARIMAQVQLCNHEFADEMRTNGAKWKTFGKFTEDGDLPVSGDSSDKNKPPHSAATSNSSPSSPEDRSVEDWIYKTYRITRGAELPGTLNCSFTEALYHEQSSLWLEKSVAHILRVYKEIQHFLREMFVCIAPDENIQRHLLPEIELILQKHFEDAKEELQKLWKDERSSLMTYNHYYSDIIQSARQQSMSIQFVDALQPVLNKSYPHTVVKQDVLACTIPKKITVNMEEYACKEAVISLKAYYKVALKRFVDNVCVQVIKRHLIEKLTSLFSPLDIFKYDEQKLQTLAGESQETQTRRTELQSLRDKLEAGLRDLI